MLTSDAAMNDCAAREASANVIGATSQNLVAAGKRTGRAWPHQLQVQEGGRVRPARPRGRASTSSSHLRSDVRAEAVDVDKEWSG